MRLNARYAEPKGNDEPVKPRPAFSATIIYSDAADEMEAEHKDEEWRFDCDAYPIVNPHFILAPLALTVLFLLFILWRSFS
jgi:hypothetical protein